jgi:hypothetical protein
MVIHTIEDTFIGVESQNQKIFFNIQMIIATTNTTIIIPTQTPASNISPISSQLERRSSREKINKLKDFVGFMVNTFLFYLITFFRGKSFYA